MDRLKTCPALRALATLVPATLLLIGPAVVFSKLRTASTFLQLVGAGCLTMVVLNHICEAFDLVPWMQWGLPNSAGHYLDLVSAVLGLVLFPIGYLWPGGVSHDHERVNQLIVGSTSSSLSSLRRPAAASSAASIRAA